ncbi:MAG: Coenzyme F420 hydrogenase/dehydrogenase, beta subunit C-terminal domain [Clostridia bacterium]|nr:Coenzyme F420 hydrogenase/dehydrogenase, beta subunit C-terminal domain [Clostridia bacterium]
MKLRDKIKCTGCGACVNICPKRCISMKQDKEGFCYPVIEESACIGCKKCEKVCGNLDVQKNNIPQSAHIGYSKKYQMDGSSGGIIGELAKCVLEDGVVYGAAFADDFSVEHIRVETLTDLPQIFKSKYTQSRVGDSFINVKKDLENNKNVLFTGTSCQIAGLNAFLGKKYENLITVEMICHGVPSPGIWQSYLKERANERSIEDVNFRDKRISWNKFCISMKFSDGSEYCSVAGEDDYMKRFLGDYILRSSCYNCEFRGVKRVADITLGDAWCEKKVLSKLPQYTNGVSSVIINSKKGLELFQKTQEKLYFVKVHFSEAIGYNNSYFLSPFRPTSRKSMKVGVENVTEIPSSHSKKDKLLYFIYRVKAKLLCLILKKRMDRNEKNFDNY